MDYNGLSWIIMAYIGWLWWMIIMDYNGLSLIIIMDYYNGLFLFSLDVARPG